MSQEQEKEIHIGEIRDFDGTLNQHVVCTVSSMDGKTTYYTIWIPRALCDWMSRNAVDGSALAIGLAVTMRLTWDEISALKYRDLLLHNSGVWISKVTYTGGIPFFSGRSVSLSRMTLTWVLARVTHLCMRGYTPEEILEFPVAGQQDDPTKAARSKELTEYVRGILRALGGEDMARNYGITVEAGAII